MASWKPLGTRILYFVSGKNCILQKTVLELPVLLLEIRGGLTRAWTITSKVRNAARRASRGFNSRPGHISLGIRWVFYIHRAFYLEVPPGSQTHQPPQ